MSININESRDHVVEFLKNNRIGVLATASAAGTPHAATIYTTSDQDLNVYFVTRKKTQKSNNLQNNHQAAIAIYNASSQTTLQAEGTVMEVRDPQKIQWVINDIWRTAAQTSSDNPPPQTQLMEAGDYIVYQLSAPSLRLATFSQHTSTNLSDIFNVVPTQPEAHFNAYDKTA